MNTVAPTARRIKLYCLEQGEKMNEYSNFVFYGSWREMLSGFDETTAKEILWQIMLYGTGGEMQTDNPLIQGLINGAIAPNIKSSQNKYCKSIVDGKKGGRPKIDLPIEEIKGLQESGQTIKAIAQFYNVSTDTIQRRLKEYAAEPQNCKTKTAKQQMPQNQDIDIYKDNYLEKDSDIFRASRGAAGGSTTKEQLEFERKKKELGF